MKHFSEEILLVFTFGKASTKMLSSRQRKHTASDNNALENIRIPCMGSIFQQGLIEANLEAFDKALDYFLDAWEM